MPSTKLSNDVCIDHSAHFVPDIEAASAALSHLGFSLTPFSEQSHRLQADGPLVPAGTANRCVMLRHGYLEFLTPTRDDTHNAQQLRDAIARYTGTHLIAFGTDAPAADYQRLLHEGFAPLPPLSLQRQVSTTNGEAIARFTVVRVAPGAMPEGRIQFCQHHTRDVVWQPRWTTHANHAMGLAGLIVCVADPSHAAMRYARFTGLPVHQTLIDGLAGAWRLDTSRGYLLFIHPDTLARTLDVVPPALPWIAGIVIDSDDMAATRAATQGRSIGEHVCVTLPKALGGVMLFQPAGCRGLPLGKSR